MVSLNPLVCLLSISCLCGANAWPWFERHSGKFLDKSVYKDPRFAVQREYADIGGLVCAYECAVDEDCTGFNHEGDRISDRGHCQLMAALENSEHEIVAEAVLIKTGYSFYDKSEYL